MSSRIDGCPLTRVPSSTCDMVLALRTVNPTFLAVGSIQEVVVVIQFYVLATCGWHPVMIQIRLTCRRPSAIHRLRTFTSLVDKGPCISPLLCLRLGVDTRERIGLRTS